MIVQEICVIMHVVYASNKDEDQSAHLRIVKSAVFVRIVERKVWCLVLPTIFNQNHTFKTLRGSG